MYFIFISFKVLTHLFNQIRRLINNLVATALHLQQYLDDGAVIPTNLLLGLFLIFAKDNVDKAALTSTSPDAFHGTSISAFQQPTSGIASQIARPNTERERCAI